jgi:FtsP/CotA-like multicopper oxidase with cupredoxin domain
MPRTTLATLCVVMIGCLVITSAQDHRHDAAANLPADSVRDPNDYSEPDGPYFSRKKPFLQNGIVVWEYKLTITEQQVRLANGIMYKVWAYGDRVPGPTLRAREGDLMRVHVSNETSSFHTIHFHGLFVPEKMDGVPPTSPVIAPGESFTYEFIARPAGTHFYHCHVDSNEHLNRGMSGALIVEPKIPEPHVDKDVVLLLAEWNSKYAQEGRPGNPSEVGSSDFFTFNARSFPYTEALHATLGDIIRIRLINVGSQSHSIHLHGHSFLVTHKDGKPLHEPTEMDTVAVAPGERTDIVFRAANLGEWPIHCHTPAHQTNAGTYPGGMMVHLMVAAHPGVQNAGDPVVHTRQLRLTWRESAIRHGY